MKAARAIVFVAALTSLMTGCGTVCNFASGSPAVYGGVAKDLEFSQTSRSGYASGPSAITFLGLWLADLGVSFVADTVTLPVTLYLYRNDNEPNVDGGVVVPAPKRVAHEPDPRPEG